MGGILALLLPTITGLLDRLIPDEAARQKAQLEMQAALLKMAADGDLAQIEVNKVEAAHASIFVAGWRPAIGWLCALALAWAYVGAPVARWAVAVWAPEVTLPDLDLSELWPLIMGMLGLGGLRSFEKVKGAGTMALGPQPAAGAPKLTPGRRGP